MNIGCVVMAAGNSLRFGSNKLLQEIDGLPMICRALSSVPAEQLTTVTVVTQYHAIAEMAAEFGFSSVINPHPEWGISHTIALGIRSMPEVDAILFLVADQPWLKKHSVELLLENYRLHPDQIVALAHHGKRGNPCIFPAEFFAQLRSLQGDTGGSFVIRQHPERLLLVEATADELQDVDTPEELH